MKKRLEKVLLWSFVAMMGAMTMVSCQPDFEPDINLMYGTWREGTEHYRYDKQMSTVTTQNGEVKEVNGATWDTADDVTEAEAQPFRWELQSDNLTQIHIMEMGADIPKVYTVVELTNTEMVYEDMYGNAHSFVKVK